MSSTNIGFIGLGNMGGRMSKCIVRNGGTVVGFDTNAAVVVEAGATPATSIKDVVTACDVVLLSLPDSRVVEKVVFGDEGILAHVRDGLYFVEPNAAAAALDGVDNAEDAVEGLGIAFALLQDQHFTVKAVEGLKAFDQKIFDELLLQVVVCRHK